MRVVTPAMRARQAEVARTMTSQQRRGLTLDLPHQRVIVISFASASQAEAWDRLDDESAIKVLWSAVAP